MNWVLFDKGMSLLCMFAAVFVLGTITKLLFGQDHHNIDSGRITELAVIACVLAGLSVVMTALGSR